jgi:hypothetical protein
MHPQVRTDTRVRAIVAAGALAVGTMLLTATAAQAQPTTVKADCEKAGGTYSSSSTSSETCCFKTPVDNSNHYCKEYLSGDYIGNSIVTAPAPTSPRPNPLAPGNVLAPGAEHPH